MTGSEPAWGSGQVSVLITVFNNADLIGEAIESVVGQSMPPGEVLVVDDGSTDGSAGVARSFGDRVRVVRQENLGVSRARNRAVAESRLPLIASVDADDRWAANKLELQLPLLVGDVEAVGCLVAQVPEAEWQQVAIDGGNPTQVLRGPVWESVLIRRASFLRVGEFDPTYRLAEQLDWWSRAADAGLRTATVERPLVFRRLHADNHGIRNRQLRDEYVRAAHAALVRRRGTGQRGLVGE